MNTAARAVLWLPVFLSATRAEEEEGFTPLSPLFNGRDLTGWVNVNCAPETFAVRDEAIVCTGSPSGVLRTERQYEDFILELEWRHLKKGGNAGVFVHSTAFPPSGNTFTKAIECQIMDGNHGDVFAIQGSTLTPDRPHPQGWMRCLPSEARARPAPEWNHYRIECRSGRVALSVNGKEVSGGTQANPRRGYICLESEGSEVHYRRIRLRELPAAKPAAGEEAGKLAAKDSGQDEPEWDPAFRSLFNGVDLRGFRDDPGHRGHWTARDGVLRYDGKSEAGDKNLWTQEEFKDFVLIADWRLTRKPETVSQPVILPSGEYSLRPDGSRELAQVADAGDSGIYLRGSSKSQINIWCWPVGSGEVYGYREDRSLPPEVRAGVTPRERADRPPGSGQWNRFVITLQGDRLTVDLNGKRVIERARLPGIAERGPLAFQHHGDPVEFRNIYVKDLAGSERAN